MPCWENSEDRHSGSVMQADRERRCMTDLQFDITNFGTLVWGPW